MNDSVDEAFRRAATACLDGLYGFAMALARDRSRAEDLVQETYLRAFAARRHAEPGPGLRPWLFTILLNAWRNQGRRAPASALDEQAVVDRGGADPEEMLARSRLRVRVRAALDELPDAFRAVVVLRCVEGFSYKEIAEIVGCPVGTVMSRLARGRALLRHSLRDAEAPRRVVAR